MFLSLENMVMVYLTNSFEAPGTNRQQTSDNEYNGNVSSGVITKGGHLSNKFEAPGTLKQITSDNEYTGSANSYSKASQSYTASKNMISNTSKEEVAKGRTFTQQGKQNLLMVKII